MKNRIEADVRRKTSDCSAASLFAEALGMDKIGSGWHVERFAFDAGAGQLVLYLNFTTGRRYRCGACGERDGKVYDTRPPQEWRHLNFLHYRMVFRSPIPRVSCPVCGIRQARVPWARARSSHTLAFEYFVARLATHVPLRLVADIVEESDTRVRRLVARYKGRGNSS